MPNYEIAHSYETVTLLRDGAAARIELNRPETMNAWNRQLGSDLLDAITTVSHDTGVRAVEIGGGGGGLFSPAEPPAGVCPPPPRQPGPPGRGPRRYYPL